MRRTIDQLISEIKGGLDEIEQRVAKMRDDEADDLLMLPALNALNDASSKVEEAQRQVEKVMAVCDQV